MYRIINKIFKGVVFFLINLFWHFRPELSTSIYAWLLRRGGAEIIGTPNYLSAKIWFDGSDYSRISLGKDVTISSNVRVLTHDWSIFTVGKGLGYEFEGPVGVHRKIKIGNYVFVGTGSILMPGCEIGDCSIVGAGSVVRGIIPPNSIVIGNPAQVVGNAKEYVDKQLKNLGGI
ncbi:acyltransferase [Porticoccaceae bacterium LTM1]|nr:acyltransferase [Porticoccaceae bacterium LTM1]